MKWKYGNSWEKYPIEKNEIWIDKNSNSIVSVYNITKDFPEYMLDADMVYCDSPWNLGNANCFITKASSKEYINSFDEFYNHLFQHIKSIKPYCCYLEIGKQYIGTFKNEMLKIFPSIQTWQITYYKKNPCFLIRGGHLDYQEFNFENKDDTETPLLAIKAEKPKCVADLCTGQGLTAIAAYRSNVRFVGTELNKRRLAVAIDKVNKLGGCYEKNSIS